MKVYINTETLEYPVYESDIKKEFSNTSFSVPFKAPAKFAQVQPVSRPLANVSKTLVEGVPILTNGEWFQVWSEIQVSQADIDARIASGWRRIRAKRNQMLRDSDWTVSISDSPMTSEKIEEWKVYRQALRDITTPVNPNLVVWPTEPSA